MKLKTMKNIKKTKQNINRALLNFKDTNVVKF